MTSTLRDIVAAHRAAAARDTRDLDALLEQAKCCPAPRDFTRALSAEGLSVIAEVKRRSPSAGALDENLDPVTLAKEYEAGGAACISVLTDVEYFGGSTDDLVAVRDAVSLPVLRKDFTVDARDIADARIIGADAILLIVAVLSDAELIEFQSLAHDLGMTALVEVHNASELQRVSGARVVGVNQRDLSTFEVDPSVAAQLRPQIPDGAITVAESAITSVAGAHVLRDAGYDAVLIGTLLVKSDDPSAMLREMVGA